MDLSCTWSWACPWSQAWPTLATLRKVPLSSSLYFSHKWYIGITILFTLLFYAYLVLLGLIREWNPIPIIKKTICNLSDSPQPGSSQPHQDRKSRLPSHPNCPDKRSATWFSSASSGNGVSLSSWQRMTAATPPKARLHFHISQTNLQL